MRQLALVAGVLIAALLLGGAGLYVSQTATSTRAAPRDLHTFMHLGCTHHTHGPRWHQDHGRTLGAKRPDGDTD